MIAKLNFVSVTGPKDDLDRVYEKYLSKYEIHLEYAPSELKSSNTLHPFVDANPYRESVAKAEELEALFDKGITGNVIDDIDSAVSLIDEMYDEFKEEKVRSDELRVELDHLKELYSKVEPFLGLDYKIDEILSFHNLKYRFGRIPKEHYNNFEEYVYDNIESVFVKAREDEEYIWGVYFVSSYEKDSVDAVYTSLHFERTYMPSEVVGTPKEECDYLTGRMDEISQKIKESKEQLKAKLESKEKDFYDALASVKKRSESFEIRKYAAITRDSGIAYYILCGWMDKRDSRAFEKEINENEPDTICIIDEEHGSVDAGPPTKLKNPRIFKPFEMYIKMYGLPSYNEMDPTIFVAITYSFIFGAMFGDVGQGLLLMIGGFILYKVKKMNLAAIISCAGFFSTIFGFMFGSIFGFEDIIDAVWLRPANAMVNLPFIGKLNTVFVVAIGFGMGLILVTMVMNIINSIKEGNRGRMIFDANGFAGLVFYGSAVLCIVLFMTGHKLPGGIVLLVMFIIPIILIALKEPIINKLNKRKELIEGGVGMFITQTFFELFELLLSYFSNSLSFVRVGAFAVSHAAMMEVVLMLAGAENGEMGNIVVVVLGNLFVCGLEGLIVGIQVLRLEYYEMFSRFYKGSGREFKAYGIKEK